MLTDYVCCWKRKEGRKKKTATTTTQKKKERKKSLKNDFENFPPGNVTAVFCIDLEMSARAVNSDRDNGGRTHIKLSDFYKLTSLPPKI